MDLASEIKKSHDEAMALADKAYACKNSGSLVEAIEYFKQALEKEKKAAYKAQEEQIGEPSQSIFFKGATYLAVNAGYNNQAKELIVEALRGNPPREIAEELWELYIKVSFPM